MGFCGLLKSCVRIETGGLPRSTLMLVGNTGPSRYRHLLLTAEGYIVRVCEIDAETCLLEGNAIPGYAPSALNV